MRTNSISWLREADAGELLAYQLERINAQAALLAEASEHYSYLKDMLPLRSPEELEKLPFTTAEDLLRLGTKLVCVPQRVIRRIVSLSTSGTKDAKRIYFTDADLQRTAGFFSQGMSALCSSGDTAAIFLPGNGEYGVSDLLRRSLERMGADARVYGLVTDCADAVRFLRQFRPHTVVGAPACVRRLSLEAPDAAPANVLLSADYISASAKASIARHWGCEVFEHYGLTESCYGFAVDCGRHSGMHIRNDEFYVEIIDPATHRPLPPGREGIIAFTTLRREAMPLLRYLTGDIGMISPQPCGCGLSQPRLQYVRGRAEALRSCPNIYELDEAVYACDEVLDYEVCCSGGEYTLYVLPVPGNSPDKLQRILEERFPHVALNVRICPDLSPAYGSKRVIRRAITDGGIQ